ncbi:hypothetical protein [Ornithinimicrobium kibberense]|uniref:hypothetical protein n=1 Tax=Ornithinimicrobium kibberense TaxID=282060 RepID=UPI00361C2CC1
MCSRRGAWGRQASHTWTAPSGGPVAVSQRSPPAEAATVNTLPASRGSADPWESQV